MFARLTTLTALSVAATALPASAAIIEGTFAFENPSFHGDTVTGTFTFDSSDPTTMTGFTLNWTGGLNLGFYDLLHNTNPFVIEVIVNDLPEYTTGPFGAGLYGSISAVTVLDGDLPIYWGATFAGDTATITTTVNNFDFDGVSGPITYTVTPAPGALAAVGAGALLVTRRRRA